MKLLVNILLSQLGWIVCVTQGDLLSQGFMYIVLAVHLFWVVKPVDRTNEMIFICAAFALGFAVDTILSLCGVLLFQQPTAGFIPLWLVSLWVIFLTTIRHSLYVFAKTPTILPLVGAIFGAFAYYMGTKLNSDVSLMQPTVLSLLVLAIVWAILFPSFFKLNSLLANR